MTPDDYDIRIVISGARMTGKTAVMQVIERALSRAGMIVAIESPKNHHFYEPRPASALNNAKVYVIELHTPETIGSLYNNGVWVKANEPHVETSHLIETPKGLQTVKKIMEETGKKASEIVRPSLFDRARQIPGTPAPPSKRKTLDGETLKAIGKQVLSEDADGNIVRPMPFSAKPIRKKLIPAEHPPGPFDPEHPPRLSMPATGPTQYVPPTLKEEVNEGMIIRGGQMVARAPQTMRDVAKAVLASPVSGRKKLPE